MCLCPFVSRLISRAKSPDVEGFLEAPHAGPGELCGPNRQPGEVAAFSLLPRSITKREEGATKG